MSGGAGRWLLVLAAVVMAAAVIAAIRVTGGPGVQRMQRLDARRVADLARLELQIQAHAGREGALPPDLDTLARGATEAGERVSLLDPEGQPYRYEPLDARRYRLCAHFAMASNDGTVDSGPGSWLHPAGDHCFMRALVQD
jgi:uncharacterized protein (DUF58 family)